MTGSSPGSEAALAHVLNRTEAKVHVFLTQLAEGVSDYRSMHNLTQQVEHQYHGRFVIELIQNAHDALRDPVAEGGGGRIEVTYDPDDTLHGSLLVANDGTPFTPSNFQNLSDLGQSDKDPQKNIGNKGLGFRSVLEICEGPEIYSRASGESQLFDGYCFAFRPSVVRSLVEPITQLATGDDHPVWSETGKPVIKRWSAEMLALFRERVRSNGLEWLAGETNFLSPYLLPVPLAGARNRTVAEFESRGFATVVRLPLKSADARSSVLRHMEQLGAATVLFLEKVVSLRVRELGAKDRTFARTAVPMSPEVQGQRVVVRDETSTPREYGVWKRQLRVREMPDEFRRAVAGLSGRWPEIQEITVALAVRWGDVSEPGRFSIFLPTLQETGSATHVNAPFYGELNRTSINFENGYNRGVLEVAADLAVEVVRHRLVGRGPDEARAIVDLLAPMGTGPVAGNWLTLIRSAAERASADLVEENLVLAERGWQPFNVTSFVPVVAKAAILTEDTLRRNATFEIFHPCLASRSAQLVAWAEATFPGIGAYPTTASKAETVAAVAREVHERGGDWNGFWRDVLVLLPTGHAALSQHEVLLGADGALHSADGDTKVFFVPRQGTQDDFDISGEGGATDIPPSLRSAVAFLSDDIQLYDPNRPTTQTLVRAYLGREGLVSQFRVETIFREVLHALTPDMPAAIDGPDHARCRDILVWAMRLMGNIVARGRGSEATLELLRAIPVPCEGGWHPMREANFGPGWKGSVGDVLGRYLAGLGADLGGAARLRLLLPPAHPAWGGVGEGGVKLLVAGGVADGLRLEEIKPSAWASQIRASPTDWNLPVPPPGLSKEFWSEYVAAVKSEAKPPFWTYQTYQAESVFAFPGMSSFVQLPDELRAALCELILQSLPSWKAGMEPWGFVKRTGQWGKFSVTSPLRHMLRTAKWLAVREDKRTTWSQPSERWLVPADILAGRARQFTHLRAVSVDMARTVGQRPLLAEGLRSLGMPFFDPHTASANPALLMALTAAVGGDMVSDTNVLLGQLRDAWHRFRPPQQQAALPQVVVRRRDKRLTAFTATTDTPAYVPDSAAFVAELESFDLPVVAIQPSDAKDLRPWFAAAFGGRIEFTSSLSLVPQANGGEWTGVEARPFAESDLGWLFRPLLVLAAEGRGVHSPAFKERVDTLSQTRVDWVPRLSVALLRGNTQIAAAEAHALWVPQRRTLIASERCRAQPEDLCEVLAQLLEREDLEWKLRFALRSVQSLDEAPDSAADFLAPLRISNELVHEVLEHLKGDVSQMAKFVAILVRVLEPVADTSQLQDAGTEDDLVQSLAGFDLAGMDPAVVLDSARESPDLFDFGRSLSQAFGSRASLARWNDVLASVGQPPLVNRNWSIQLQAVLEAATAQIKRLTAHAIRTGTQRSYQEMMVQYQAAAGTADLGRSHWSVEFADAMEIVAHLVKGWAVEEAVIQAIRGANSVDDLRERLAGASVDVELDPDDCGRKNHDTVQRVVAGLEQIRLSAWAKRASAKSSGDWVSLADHYRHAADHPLRGRAFTTVWTETDVFAMMKSSRSPAEMPVIQDALDATDDLASLRAALGLSDDDLAKAEARLEAVKAERMRRRHVVQVCGEDFDGSEDNLNQLWKLVSDHIGDEDLDVSRLDLAKPAALDPIKTRQRKKSDKPTAPPKRVVGSPKPLEDLIGLAGEIHVFRMLQKKYGKDAVTASAWVSGNSLHVFPFNQPHDTLGYDFTFAAGGKLFRVEVKATMGDDESFSLGSSEIRLAMELGTSRKRRKEVFVLVHVRQALSATPDPVVLPNPYDEKHRGRFSIDEAEARVRYRAPK